MIPAIVVGVLCVLSLPRCARSEQPSAPPVPAPTGDRADAEGRLRELFSITMEISRLPEGAERTRLEVRRERLLEEIRALELDVPAAPDRPGLTPDNGTAQILRALEQAGENIDWEEINGILGGGMKGLGEGIRVLGEQLEDLELEVGPDRVKLGNRETGDRLVFQIPPELHETLKEGIGAIAIELEGAFRDSAHGQFDLLEGLARMEGRMAEGEGGKAPSALLRRFFPRQEVERRVVADSVFKFSEDFEVEEDEIVQGDIFVVSGDVYVGGEVQGSVYVLLGNIWVDESGTLGKDAVSLSGSIEVDGTVHGHRFAMGEMVPGMFSAGLGGLGSFNFLKHGVRVALQALLLFLGVTIIGDRLVRMTDHATVNAGRSLVSGGLWLAVVIGGFSVAAVGLVFTVIGIPVALVLTIALWLALLGSYFVACEGLGQRILSVGGDPHPRKLWMAGLVGMALLESPTFLYASVRPVDDLGDAAMVILAVDYGLKFLALAIGFGALIATRAGGAPRAADPAGLLAPVEA